MKLFRSLLAVVVIGLNLQSFAETSSIPAVDDLNREYNFLHVDTPDFKLPFKVYENGPYRNLSVNSSSKLCSTNFPYMSEAVFNQLFETRGDRAALKKGNYDVIKAYGDSRDFGSECVRGHYEPDTSGESNGPREVFVCDEATRPTTTRYYVTVRFRTNLSSQYGLAESVLYCIKEVPYGSSESMTIQEIETDVIALGLRLKN